ncbi:MAG: glutathione S-transferase family protein [Gammaproteobacteria bacterium]|nr:glutathione S-transferase family protein [Gammaproteobacteria bacterium]
MKTPVQLYSMAICPFAQRTRILLNLKNIEFDLTEMDSTRQMPDWFLKLNPLGQVPVIHHDGVILNESSVINEYLEECFPVPCLFPSTPYQKALCRILIDYGNREFIPNLYHLLMNQRRERDAALIDQALKTWRWVNDFLVRYNPDGTYLFDGEGFGIAELSYGPFFQRYCLNAYYRFFEVPETQDYLRVIRWRDAILREPVVIETGMSNEAFIKYYYDYSLGYGNGAIPPGHKISSFDRTFPLEERPMPPRPDRLASCKPCAAHRE